MWGKGIDGIDHFEAVIDFGEVLERGKIEEGVFGYFWVHWIEYFYNFISDFRVKKKL
jgi:hypothetical protein